ncbi:MAG: WHG domain-containing protein [Anaeroplasma bactoclasticum]|nr:WHG domain-containing protein [Anaeroplasma bactoclasticum]
MPPKTKFTKEQIIEVALTLVKEEGIDALTARALGKRLGTSSCPIFTIFTNMDEVYQSVVQQAQRVYKGYIQKGLQKDPAFKGVGMQYIQFAQNEPQLFRLLFMRSTPSTHMDQLLPLLDENYDLILSSVQEAYGLSKAKAKKVYLHMTIYTHGIATFLLQKSYMFTQEEISQMLTEIFISLLMRMKGESANDYS